MYSPTSIISSSSLRVEAPCNIYTTLACLPRFHSAS